MLLALLYWAWASGLRSGEYPRSAGDRGLDRPIALADASTDTNELLRDQPRFVDPTGSPLDQLTARARCPLARRAQVPFIQQEESPPWSGMPIACREEDGVEIDKRLGFRLVPIDDRLEREVGRPRWQT